MKAMRVIVTASRTWDDWKTVHDALDEIAHAARRVGERLIVAHGCAAGGDLIADGWVRRRLNAGWPVEVQRFPPDYKRYKRQATHIRNREMVRLGADACIAFINLCADTKCHKGMPHGSHGAVSTARLADGEGIKTQRIGPGADCEADFGIPTQRIERSTKVSDG